MLINWAPGAALESDICSPCRGHSGGVWGGGYQVVGTVAENKAAGRGGTHRRLTNALRAFTVGQCGSKHFELDTS